MRKIWYLKQEKGQKTKTAKVFLYEKEGHVEGRMDLSAFCNCGQEEGKSLLLHMKDISGKDVGKINLEEGTVLYEGFLQGKGKLREELAEQLRTLKGETALSVTIGKERYLSEGWIDREIELQQAERKSEKEKAAGKEKSQIEEKRQVKEKRQVEEKRQAEYKRQAEEGQTEEKVQEGKIRGEKAEGVEEKGKIAEEETELEAEELLQEESEEKRIVQLAVLEDELLFRSYIHNSFLLHGYYNYGHVMIDESGTEPRLGVPGNYYEREQMVAEMFGFPVFEAAREGEQITNGTFGYFYTKG